MSKQQLAAILEMSARNPIPANATPAVMRAWVEDFAGQRHRLQLGARGWEHCIGARLPSGAGKPGPGRAR
jgi:hypothetical protein